MRLARALGGLAFFVTLWGASAEASSIDVFSSLVCGGGANGPAPQGYSQSCDESWGAASTSMTADGSLTSMLFDLFYEVSSATGGVVNGPGAGLGVVINDVVIANSGAGSGSLYFRWAVDGTLDAEGVFLSTALMESALAPGFTGLSKTLCGGPGSGGIDPCVATSGPSVSELVEVVVPFTDGVPIPLHWILRGSVGTSSMGISQSGKGAASFAATLQPLVVLDGNGSQLTGVSVVSESGFSYPVAPAGAVPEPGAAVLFALGASVVGYRRLGPVR